MRKFKLIKEYPGSIVVGSIEECGNQYIIDKHYSMKEFWQEIIEKDYEILSFKCKHTGDLWIEDYDMGKWYFSRRGNITAPYMLKKMLIHENYYIYSVKRLSDGEIFTIGDKCDDGEVIEFYISGENLFLNFKPVFFQQSRILKYCKKVKTPLFTTEDGVEIFNLIDGWWVVNIFNFDLYSSGNGYPLQLDNKNLKRFKTRDKAQKFIDENQKIMIGDHEVNFGRGLIGPNIKIENRFYDLKDLLFIHKVLNHYSSQIKSLNVGCSGQYKVDLNLINKIIAKLQSM